MNKLSVQLKTFSERLRWVRGEYGMSLEEFASRLSAGKSYLSKLERGVNKQASAKFVKLVCSTYGVRIEWLTEGDGLPFISKPLSFEALAGEIQKTRFKIQSLSGAEFDNDIMTGIEHASLHLRAARSVVDLSNSLIRLVRDAWVFAGDRAMSHVAITIVAEELHWQLKNGSVLKTRLDSEFKPVTEGAKIALASDDGFSEAQQGEAVLFFKKKMDPNLEA